MCLNFTVVTVRKQKRRRCGWTALIFMAHLDFVTLLIFVTYFVLASNFCREVMVHWAFDQQGMIEGQGRIVEIDESRFSRCKDNVGRVINGQWVFGGTYRETRSLPRPGGGSDQRDSPWS